MIGAAFTIAAISVAAFHGPTWAWVALAAIGAAVLIVEAVG